MLAKTINLTTALTSTGDVGRSQLPFHLLSFVGSDQPNFEFDPRARDQCSKFVKCNRNRCITCTYVIESNCERKVWSYITGKSFSIYSTSDESLTCTSKFVVYLISCKKCGVQYVGETGQELKARFLSHRRCVINLQPGMLYSHFQQDSHSVDDMSLQVLGRIDSQDKSELRRMENAWIRVLCTAWPFGLNDRIDGYGDMKAYKNPVFAKNQPYLSIPLHRIYRNRGIRHKRHKKRLDLEVQKQLLTFYQASQIRTLYVYLRALNKGMVRKLLMWANAKKFGFTLLDTTLQFILLGYCASYYKTKPEQKTEKLLRISANFVNKGFDMIHFEKLVSREDLKQLAPKDIKIPKVSLAFRLKEPMSLTLCNYSKELSKFDTSKMKHFQSRCECVVSPYKYDPCGHIVTGDLSIIRNRELEHVFYRGTKFRENCGVDWKELEKELQKLTETYILKIARFNKVDVIEFKQYKIGILQKIREIISKFELRYPSKKFESIFSNFEIRNKLKLLQERFIICCADKAANNYVFVCKYYYLSTICAELGISFDGTTEKWVAQGNRTYSVCNLSSDDIVNIHKNFTVGNQFALPFHDKIAKIPKIHCLPKLHKTPYGNRFICGAGQTSIMPLSKLLHHVETHLRNHFRNQCNVIRRRTGINCYWSIQNNEPVLCKLSEIVSGQTIGEANSFDFSTLFTMLPHSVVEEQLIFLIDKMFGNNGHRDYIAIRKEACIRDNFYGEKISFYTNAKENPRDFTYLTCTDVKLLVQINLQQSFVKFGEYIFKQNYGISMGGSASPLTCDLTLSILEYKFMLNPSNKGKIKELNSVYRYIDDILCTSCGRDRFLELAKEIYPTSLPLNHASGNGVYCDFLDLRIYIAPEFKIDVFNKTDYFNFQVVKYVFAESNAPRNLGYNVFHSQLVRISRICTKLCDFREKVASLAQILVQNGFDKDKLIIKFLKFANKYPEILFKFNIFDKKDILVQSSKIFSK
ncbi:MAG: hypothetical protein GY739_07705 [Mesoflavibacter sp.]|nr:hypothetical protein [Mesoflavibacter sp.]